MNLIALKQLTKTDLRKLTVPMKNFSSFPQPRQGYHTKDFQIRDESGRVWPVCVSTRKKGKHKKPVINGWRKVVLDMQLRKDDKVSFFKEVDQATGEAEYMIKVEKPMHAVTGALVHGTEDATGKASYIVALDDAPVHGFDQVSLEGDFKIEEKRGTMMTGAIGAEENGTIKLFGVTINDATIHGFNQSTGEAHETEEKREIKLFGITLVEPVLGVA